MLAAQLPTDQADEAMDDDPGSGEIFFGTTKRLKPVPTLDDGDFIPAPGGAADASGADAAGASAAGASGAGAEDSDAAPSEAGGSEEGGPGVTAEGDGEDDPYGDDPYADGSEDDDPERPTRAMRQTASRPRRPRGARPGSGLVRRPTARMTRPLGPGLRPRRPTQVLRRPAGPPSPVAPLDPNAPPALEDWAQAIGRLMTLKGSITKIVVETGDKSHVLFKTGGSE